LKGDFLVEGAMRAWYLQTGQQWSSSHQSNELARAERDRLLMNDGTTAVQAEHQALRRQLDEKIADIQPHLSTIKLSCGSDASEYVIRTARVSLNFCLYIAFPPTESRIVVQEFDRPLILPGTRSGTFIGGHGPSLG
jgi:hypothetical protein